jgi:hypothetical protein
MRNDSDQRGDDDRIEPADVPFAGRLPNTFSVAEWIRRGGRSGGHRFAVPAFFGALQTAGEQGGVKPGGESLGQAARPEESSVSVREQVSEGHEPDEPAVQLGGVGFQGEIDGQALVVPADP